MSDTSAFGFGQFVPGFDFLQNLSKSAAQPSTPGAAIPGLSSWVAPTLSVEELDKRIQELKAVQFWLEQNGTALKATIQALEVQKMTLTTLQGMNVNMAELAKAFTAKAPESTPTPEPSPEPVPEAAPQPAASTTPPAPASSAQAQPEAAAPRKAKASGPRSAQAQAGTRQTTVDPMQWWGSLTQQFQNIAAAAMQDAAAQALQTKDQGKPPKKTPTAAAAADKNGARAKGPARPGQARPAVPRKRAAAPKKASGQRRA